MSKKSIYIAAFVFTLGLVLTSVSKAADPDLAAYWNFDEGSGTTAFDSSGNGNDGVFNGDPQWVAGKYGGALEFNGDDYLNCGNGDSLQIQDEITIAFWFQVDSFQITWEAFMTKGDDSYRSGRGGGTGNATHLGISGTSVGDGNGFFNGTVIVTDGQWHHYAATYDGVEARIYIDGVLDVTSPGTGQINISTYDFWIGCNSQNTDRLLTGLLDDVCIYSRALTDTEILVVMSGAGVDYPFASTPIPTDGALHSDTFASMSWRAGDFAVSHDVYFGESFDDVNEGTGDTFQANQNETYFVAGFPGVAYPYDLVPGTTYYWRIDEVNDTDPNSPWQGNVWSFMLPPRTAYAPDPADAAEYVDQNLQLSWSSGLGVKLHYVYFGDNFYDVNNAAGGSPQGAATYFPCPLRLAHTYYWRVDEFDSINTYKGDVWSFTTYGAVRKPNPANGAVDVKQTQIITWFPSVSAASHELYFGTDKDSVKNADTTSPEYKGTRALGDESYDPGKLEWNVTYYWRIDEVNNADPNSPWTGILWSFTTANFLVVDDFESYNDIDPPDPLSNRIFESWSDGYEIPTNGALVGNDLPPYSETSIVHCGSQSMPCFCDNSFGYSEATLTLTYPRDWTENGVNRLTIWFRGDSANAAETLYIALNDRATVYHDNPNAALIDTWTEWTIDLQAFADQGVNLTNVNSISIGFGDWNNLQPGGSGTMYFDDIRLYRSSEPEPEPLP